MNRQYSQTLLILLGFTVLAALVWFVIFARPLVYAVLIAGLLAYLLDPLVSRLEVRLGLSRRWAAHLVYGATLLILVGLIVLLGSVALDRWPRWQAELTEASLEVERWLSQPFVLFGFQIDALPLLREIQRSLNTTLRSVPRPSLDLLGAISDNLLWSLVVFMSLYYFLVDGPKIKPTLVSLLSERYRPEGAYLLDEIDRAWGIFLRMQLLIFAILTILVVSSTTLILLLFRAGWLPLSPVGLGILLILVYTAIQQIDNFWLRPQWMGRTLELHPGVVFVSLIGALALSGVLGAILIVPLLATLKLVARYIHAKLLGLPVELPPDKRAAASPEHPPKQSGETPDYSQSAPAE